MGHLIPRVLIACECSGRVREAFRLRGLDAWSCDLQPADDGSPYHLQGDALEAAHGQPWDLMIAHPPCTDLASSGAAWMAQKRLDGRQAAALAFVRGFFDAPVKRIAIENPVGVISSLIRKPDQIVHPWQFGHGDMKTTCLWLKNLPKLRHTRYVEREYVTLADGSLYPKWSYDTFRLPAADRAKVRSVTFSGIADAMADQWGYLLLHGKPAA